MKNAKAELKKKCEKDYALGKTYKDISLLNNVSINTLKTWKKREGWKRNPKEIDGCVSKAVSDLGNKETYRFIKDKLLEQLKNNDSYQPAFIDLIEDYMRLWEIKNALFKDAKQRGVMILWENGKQKSTKPNDSINQVLKVNAQMLKILLELNLKPVVVVAEKDEEI